MFSVLIRPLREPDALTSYKWRNDPEIWLNTGRRPERQITEQIEKEWIRKVLAEEDSARFAIVADNTYIGNIQITNIKPGEEGEYHIFIGDKNYWGKGIATLASLQLIRYAREKLGLKRLYLTVKPQHEAAISVYRKCGFVTVSEEVKMVCDLVCVPIPAVSVFMITYNHEDYIRQSVESVLYQKANFDFDIVIGEDCSTDGTRSIIKAIADEYPGKFRLLFHERNLGANVNQLEVFKACTGKYIAMCEGDDYWTATDKLQKSVDFLEQNPSYSLVCTDYGVLDQLTGRITEGYLRETYNLTKEKDVQLTEYMFSRHAIRSLTAVIQGSAVRAYFGETDPRITHSNAAGDLPLWLFIMSISRVRFLPISTAMYRVNPGTGSRPGNIHKRKQFRDGICEILEYYIDKNNLPGSFRRKLKVQRTIDAMEYYRDTGDRNRMWKLFSSLGLRGFAIRRALAIVGARGPDKQKSEN